MDKKVLVIEHSYEAPVEKVWEAITNKDLLRCWYFEVSDFQAEVGFKFQFYGENDGTKYLHKCTIVEVEPKTKISYTWGYDGYIGQSLVVFELFSEDKNKTRLKLTHSGLDTFLSHPDFSQANFNDGWHNILGKSLRNFLEMDSFTKDIHIDANLKDIWDIVLAPNNKWGDAFGEGAFVETDWKEGSSIIWRDTENNIGAIGIVEVHQPEKYLKLHYYDELKPRPNTMLGNYYEKLRIASDKDGFTLSVEIGKIAKSDVTFHQEMWDNALNIIKRLAEKE